MFCRPFRVTAILWKASKQRFVDGDFTALKHHAKYCCRNSSLGIPSKVSIKQDPLKAIKKHNETLKMQASALHIYTDGSVRGKGTGAAAVCTTTKETRTTHMRNEDPSAIFFSELKGIELGLRIAVDDKAQGNERSKALIYTDSRTSAEHVKLQCCERSPKLLKQIEKRVEKLQTQGTPVEILWIPGHRHIPGNMKADREAKKAAGRAS